MKIPKNDRKKVIIPIIMAGITIEVSIKDRLNPTANASILVAMDKMNKTLRFEEQIILFDSMENDS